MKRDIRVYTKKDVFVVSNVYHYNIYHKINTLEIVTRHKDNNEYYLEIKKYDLKDIIQIDITTRTNNNDDIITDFILF